MQHLRGSGSPDGTAAWLDVHRRKLCLLPSGRSTSQTPLVGKGSGVASLASVQGSIHPSMPRTGIFGGHRQTQEIAFLVQDSR